MTSIDYTLLKGGGGGDPPDGLHTATLLVAKVRELQSGDRLVTEWQISTPVPYYWTTWHGFEANRINITQDYLDGLGVDRSAISDDTQFEAALNDAVGRRYEIRTSAWSGGINTYVEGALEAAQNGAGGVSDDIPADTADLTPAATLGDDEPIPF